MRKKFAICSSENLLKNCAINFYSYSSFWKQQKHFRVVKFSKMLPTFYKTTAKKIHSIFNLESFFDFFGDASQKSYQKRYMLIWKNILLIKKLSKRMKKKNIMSIMPLPFLSLISLLLHNNTLYFYDVKYKYLQCILKVNPKLCFLILLLKLMNTQVG